MIAQADRDFGTKGDILQWRVSFLNNKKQRVKVNKYSEWKDVISNIPQGRTLGPVLFVIYISDLPGTVSLAIYLSADDTKIFRRKSNEGDHYTLHSN